MDKPDLSRTVYHHLGRHAAEFEYFDFLTVKFQYRMAGIRQPYKRQRFIFPILFERAGVLRTHHHNNGILFNEFSKVLTQLRHVPAAEWSQEAPVENKDNVAAVFKVRKPDGLAVKIVQFEIRGRL
jgi:hypothetical protein